jgi:hypothetical protein
VEAATKFTPGPWHIDGEEDRIVIWTPAPMGRFHIADTVGGQVYPVAAVDDDGEQIEDYSDYREVEANARLIAAAPALYEVLQRIVADDRAALDPDDYHAARAALASAGAP